MFGAGQTGVQCNDRSDTGPDMEQDRPWRAGLAGVDTKLAGVDTVRRPGVRLQVTDRQI